MPVLQGEYVLASALIEKLNEVEMFEGDKKLFRGIVEDRARAVKELLRISDILVLLTEKYRGGKKP